MGKDGTPFVHSKVYIIDDQFAIIGSANCNRRGIDSDTEVVAGIADTSTLDHPALHFAHRFRVALWAHHLNLDTPTGHAELLDGVASAVHWAKPPAGAQIEPYQPTAGTSLQTVLTVDGEQQWDSLWTPCYRPGEHPGRL